MVDPSIALLKGIRDALRGSTALADLVGERIYTAVPRNATFPFVVFSVEEMTPYSGSANLCDCYAEIDIYSREPKPAQLLAIKAAVLGAASFEGEIDDCAVIISELESATEDPEVDGTLNVTISMHYVVQTPRA